MVKRERKRIILEYSGVHVFRDCDDGGGDATVYAVHGSFDEVIRLHFSAFMLLHCTVLVRYVLFQHGCKI